MQCPGRNWWIPVWVGILVSGTVGERWGRRRVTRTTFLVYAAASVVCVVAPTLGLFVAARALQGAANAFIPPMLLAGLTEVIAPGKLGRAIGAKAIRPCRKRDDARDIGVGSS